MTFRLLTPIVYGILAVGAVAAALKAPVHGWDMIAYIGATKYYETRDPAAVHAYAYGELRRSVPPAAYAVLAPDQAQPQTEKWPRGAEEYRMAMARNPNGFVEQLPYYQIRPLYIFPVYLLTKAGLDAVTATHVVSGVAVAIGFVLLYFIVTAVLPPPLALLAAPFAIILGPFDLARRATPDGVSFCAAMLLTYLFATRRLKALLWILPLTVAARTDLVLFIGPLYLLLLARNDAPRRAIIASFVATAAVYLGVNLWWHNPGFGTTFVHSFIERQTYPVSAPSRTLALSDYFGVLVQIGIASSHWLNRVVLLYLVIAACSLYLVWGRREALGGLRASVTTPAATLALASAAYVAAHVIVFPVLWERYFAGIYMLGLVGLLWLLAEQQVPRAATDLRR